MRVEKDLVGEAGSGETMRRDRPELKCVLMFSDVVEYAIQLRRWHDRILFCN
jgi:hypothetical protein